MLAVSRSPQILRARNCKQGLLESVPPAARQECLAYRFPRVLVGGALLPRLWNRFLVLSTQYSVWLPILLAGFLISLVGCQSLYPDPQPVSVPTPPAPACLQMRQETIAIDTPNPLSSAAVIPLTISSTYV